MKARTFIAAVLITLALCFVLFPVNAHAYLDPGTGSYVLQLALAAIVGALFAIRMFWGRIKAFFKRMFTKQEIGGQDES